MRAFIYQPAEIALAQCQTGRVTLDIPCARGVGGISQARIRCQGRPSLVLPAPQTQGLHGSRTTLVHATREAVKPLPPTAQTRASPTIYLVPAF